MDYLLKNSYISHEGEHSSQVGKRASDNGATALLFGEVIGYSPLENQLFESWLLSPTHNSVILDENWHWIGISSEKVGDLYIAVINFSSGILGSTTVAIEGDNLTLTGDCVETPIFKGYFEEKGLYIEDGYFVYNIKPYNRSFFIYVYNSVGELTDRLDIFF